jgi:hypothetical protein
VAAPPGDSLITYSFLFWQNFIKFGPEWYNFDLLHRFFHGKNGPQIR